jgi:hypothetical protein
VSALRSFRGYPESLLSQKGSKSGPRGQISLVSKRVWGPKEAHGPRVIQNPLGRVRDGSRGAEEPGKTGVAPAASLDDMRQSEKAEVLQKA